jgi:hypothetical protein
LIEVADFAKEFGALTEGRGEEQDEGVGSEEGRVKGQGGDDGALASLTGTAEEDAGVGGEEQVALPGVGGEAAGGEKAGGVKRQGE